MCVCENVCVFLGSCLISRLDCYSCKGDLDAATWQLSAIFKRHCMSLSPVWETNAHCEVPPLCVSVSVYVCAQTLSCIRSSIQIPLQSPSVILESSTDVENRTFNLCLHLCVCTSSISICANVCTSARWIYFHLLQRVFQHKDKDKMRTRTTKNQWHVDGKKQQHRAGDKIRQDRQQDKRTSMASREAHGSTNKTGNGRGEKLATSHILHCEKNFFLLFD